MTRHRAGRWSKNEWKSLAGLDWELWPTEIPEKIDWIGWNTSYGAALRFASYLMTQSKAQMMEGQSKMTLAEREELIEWLRSMHDGFADMKKVLDATLARVLVSAAALSENEMMKGRPRR